MVRTEISLFLRNAPGELGKLATMLAEAKINIDALTIQDASEYVQGLFRARGKSLKRIAPAASYGSMQKDSANYALIRLLVDNTDRAIDLLGFGEEGININYVYGSALPRGKKSLFVFCPEDIELAARIFKED
ncbi:MAG: amino acid-binding protein [Deltaproteobacteria bacterium]|nr:amino acid-binding protein [Deltaproteobacteria bacterium]